MTTPSFTYIFNRTTRVAFDAAGWINASTAAKGVRRDPLDWLTGYDGMQTVQDSSAALGIQYPQGFFEQKGIFARAANLVRVLIEDQRLVRSVAGDPENGGGTWLHPDLMMPFARWIGADFAAWCESTAESLKVQLAADRAADAKTQPGGDLAGLNAAHLAEYRLAEKVLIDCGADAQERRSILAARFGGDPSQEAKRHRTAEAELKARGLDFAERQEILASRFGSPKGGA